MLQEGADGFDARPGVAAELRCGVPEHVGRDVFQSGPLRVGLQVLVEAVRADGEERGIIRKRLQWHALGTERSLDGVIGGSRELAMAKRAALRANVVLDSAGASLQVTGSQRQELRPAEPRQYRGDDDGVVSRPCRRLGDSIEKALKLVGIEPPRGRLLGFGALHIVGGVALYETHPASKVVEARSAASRTPTVDDEGIWPETPGP